MSGHKDDAIIQSIDEFLPYRNEAIQIFTTIAQYSPSEEFIRRVHRLFERLIPYMHRPNGVNQWQESDFDNFRFLVHELFLYALAVLLKHERFEQANYLLTQQYYVADLADFGRDTTVSFVVFREYLRSFEQRSNRLQLQRASLRADLLKGRVAGTGLEFRQLLQADFVAFMRAEIDITADAKRWWPETLVFASHGTLEIFARSVSRAYFEKVKILLNVSNRTDLESLLGSYGTGSRRLPRWDYEELDPSTLLGMDRLATKA